VGAPFPNTPPGMGPPAGLLSFSHSSCR
jgi:hypothetical protein